MTDDEREDVNEDPRLAALAMTIADGGAVDWSSAEAGADPDQRALIRELRAIAALSRLGSASQSSGSSCQSDLQDGGATSHALAPGDAWGPFTLRGEIGSGNFGTVYRAWDPALEREVALKVLRPIRSSAEDAAVAEAQRLAQVFDHHVVTIFGADCFEGRVGFWMELVQGLTLKQIQETTGRCSASEAILYGLDLCRALAAVHRAGFLHCDIKAQNVMRADGGRIVLMDFGAARVRRADALHDAPVTGTPVYLAPEIMMEGAPTIQSDLYSLGVLLYHLVSGEYPVTADSLEGFRVAHTSGHRRRLRDLRPDLPAAFVHVVDVATAVLPDDRPASAGALATLLERAAGRVGAAKPRASGGGPGDSRDETSIVVLPFADLSGDQSLGYFCEGLAEEIVDALTRVPGLRVVSRGPAAAFKSGHEDPQQVAAALHVTTVLQGSVRAVENRVRVIARLTDAATGAQLWSARFARTLDDIFGVQDEIAQATVRGLGLRIVRQPGHVAFGAPAAPREPEAYTLYLKGRHCWNQRTESALHRSAAYFQAAIDRDPEYAEPYASLAEAYTTLGLYGVLAPHDIMPRAAAAARRAIDMAGHLSSPHATAGCIAAVYAWAWHDAARHYHRAIELNPDHPAAHHWYAINYLVPLRRFEEASAELRRAAEADPLSMPIRASLGIRSYFAHSFEQACRELRETLDLDAGFATARLFLGLTLTEMGRHDEAIRELETVTHLAGSPETRAALGYALARAGRGERARGLLAELQALARERYISPSLIAQVHAGLGDTAAALERLEAAADAHAVDLAWLSVRPVYDGLRSDRRLNAVIGRLRQ